MPANATRVSGFTTLTPPSSVGNGATSPGGIVFVNTANGGYYLWVDTNGVLRIAAEATAEAAGFNWLTGGSPVFSGTKGAAITDLTDAFGTADGTVADVGVAFNQTTLNDNFQELSTKVNLILARLRAANIIA